jgi:long-chain acyl-CoA synthetase
LYLDKVWLKNYPPNMPIEVKVPEVVLTQQIDESVKRNADKTALLFYGTKISYSDLGRYIEKMASALQNLGIRKNSVVALFLPTCPQFVISYYAIQKLGGIPTAVNLLFSPREIRAQLEDSKAKSIILLDELYDKTKPIIEELGIKNVILTNVTYFMPFMPKSSMPKSNIPKDKSLLYFENMIKQNVGSIIHVEINPKEDVASIIYTSGTTGLPKGVALTHYNIVACIEQAKIILGDALTKSRYLLSQLPLYHIYGQIAIMTEGLLIGQTLILIQRPQFDELLQSIQKYKISLLFGVPAFYRMLIEQIKKGKYDLSSLKTCFCASDYAPQKLKDEWKALTGADILEGYGLTEAAPVTAAVVGSKAKDRSIGFPPSSTLVAVADVEKDEFVGAGKLGEIIVHGPQVMKGYWNSEKHPNPFITVADIVWLRTGDIGSMDEDGYFYMTERKKDIIKYKGRIIIPAEVESIISNYEPIKEVAVVGVQPSETEFGQIPKAFIVTKDEYKPTTKKDDIVNFCIDKLALYKIPKEIEFVDKLPRNNLGKVIRKDLRGEN